MENAKKEGKKAILNHNFNMSFIADRTSRSQKVNTNVRELFHS